MNVQRRSERDEESPNKVEEMKKKIERVAPHRSNPEKNSRSVVSARLVYATGKWIVSIAPVPDVSYADWAQILTSIAQQVTAAPMVDGETGRAMSKRQKIAWFRREFQHALREVERQKAIP